MRRVFSFPTLPPARRMNRCENPRPTTAKSLIYSDRVASRRPLGVAWVVWSHVSHTSFTVRRPWSVENTGLDFDGRFCRKHGSFTHRKLFECNYLNSCAVVNKISTDTERRAIPLRQMSLLCKSIFVIDLQTDCNAITEINIIKLFIHSFITSRRQHKKHTSMLTYRPKHKHST